MEQLSDAFEMAETSTLRHRAAKVDVVKSDTFDRFRELDLYAKLDEDHVVKTEVGGLVSLFSLALMVLLVLAEFGAYWYPGVKEQLSVDTSRITEVAIGFKISFLAIPCTRVRIDVMDVTGVQLNDATESYSIIKQRLDTDGNPVGRPMHGDEVEAHGSHNFRDMVMEALGIIPQVKEGCTVEGDIKVNKVSGNFHVAIGQSITQGARHIHQFGAADLQSFNESHVIHYLTFGPAPPAFFPPIVSPLEGVTKIVTDGTGTHQYFIKLVPTIYNGWRTVYTHQYAATEMFFGLHKGDRAQQLPGVFFMFDFAPYLLEVSLDSYTFFEFLTATCAILGGIYIIAGMLDSCLHNLFPDVSNKIRRKMSKS